jgi:hypothetical protein
MGITYVDIIQYEVNFNVSLHDLGLFQSSSAVIEYLELHGTGHPIEPS